MACLFGLTYIASQLARFLPCLFTSGGLPRLLEAQGASGARTRPASNQRRTIRLRSLDLLIESRKALLFRYRGDVARLVTLLKSVLLLVRAYSKYNRPIGYCWCGFLLQTLVYNDQPHHHVMVRPDWREGRKRGHPSSG